MKIRDRIKSLRRVKASEILPNPANWRTHPKAQREAMQGILAEVGIADALLVRETPEGLQLIDGHLRADTAPDTKWPVLVLDVTDEEAAKLLATVDPLAAMAGVDTDKLEELLRDIDTDSDALTKLADYIEKGWQSPDGRTFGASQIWIDSGYHEHTDAVYAFCQTAGKKLGAERYRPTKGYGEGQRQMTRYISPTVKKRDADVTFLGREFHIKKVRRNGRVVLVRLVHINADHWKSELHQRLAMPANEDLAVTLYQAASFAEHTEFSQHMVAEVQLEKFIPERGVVIVWDRIDRNNHWLDSTYAALCAGEAVRAAAEEQAKIRQPQSLRQLAGVK